MKKKGLALAAALIMMCSFRLLAAAEEKSTLAQPAVVFQADNTLVYTGAQEENGNGIQLFSFDGVAPGDTVVQEIVLKNENDLTVDFYMNAETIIALEDAVLEGQTAAGAAYEILLEAGDSVLYDSNVGGYTASDKTDSRGLKSMNETLKDYLYVGTLDKGDEKKIRMTIYFDGEAMDNAAGGIDYSDTLGRIAFGFQVSYQEPSGPVVVTEDVTKAEEPDGITRIVEELVPLAPVQTGDAAMLGLAVLVLAVGVLLFILAGRKKKEEEES